MTHPILTEAAIASYLDHLRQARPQGRGPARPYSALTVTAYRSKLRQFEAWLGERHLTGDVLSEYRAHLQESRRPRTIRQAFHAIGGFLAWMRGQGADAPDARDVWKPPLDVPQREVPTDAEVAQLFGAAEGLPAFTRSERLERARALAILSLAADCGLRRCEIVGLNLADVELDHRPARVLVRSGKGSKARWLPLNARARRHLAAYLVLRAEWALWMPARRANPALFALHVHCRMSERYVDSLRLRLLSAAGLADRALHLHSLRHWWITNCLGAPGINVKDVQALAGHSSELTTLKYAHARQQAMESAVEWICREEAGAGELTSGPQARSPQPHVRGNAPEPSHNIRRRRRMQR